MKETINQLKKEVLKKLFVILPLNEKADNLKIIRNSAERIIETQYVGLETIEKAIDLTLQEVCEEIEHHLVGERLIVNDDRHTESFKAGVRHSIILFEELLKKFQGEK